MPRSAFLADPDYYAPAKSVAVAFDEGAAGTYLFADNSAGGYSTIPIVITSLSDGQHTLSYIFMDQSGAISTGSINFTLHRTAPSAVGLSMISRTSASLTSMGSAVWASDGKGGWQISQADVTKVAGRLSNLSSSLSNYVQVGVRRVDNAFDYFQRFFFVFFRRIYQFLT